MYIQVRDETNKVQFGRMDKEQQEEMVRYKRPLMVEDADTKAKNIP